MLDKPRKKINEIDAQLVKLLEERYECVDEVVRIKTENNLPTLDTSRETEVLSQLATLIEKKEYSASILETFQSIMDISKGYQSQKRESRLNNE